MVLCVRIVVVDAIDVVVVLCIHIVVVETIDIVDVLLCVPVVVVDAIDAVFVVLSIPVVVVDAVVVVLEVPLPLRVRPIAPVSCDVRIHARKKIYFVKCLIFVLVLILDKRNRRTVCIKSGLSLCDFSFSFFLWGFN